jgi:hypothetical protein
MNFNKKDPVADAVLSILQQEADGNKTKRTKDDIGGRKDTKQTDDVGPGSDGKSTKVELASEGTVEVKKISATTTEKTEKPETQTLKDTNKTEKNKTQLRMKESVSLKGFKERYEEHSIFEQMVQEVLSKDASAGQWIHDFVHSDNPKFAGKSKAERKKQALAAYYAKQKNEEVEQVEESMGEKAAGDLDFISKVKGVAKKVGRVLGGPDDEGHKKDLQRKMGVPQTGKPNHAKYNEEVELTEGKMDHMSLTHLWHAHAKHTYWADQGYGTGSDSTKHADHAATAIENHVRKHHGNKVADDMVAHSGHHVAHAEYVGGKEAKEVEKSAEKLRKKHNIKGDLYGNHEHMNEGVVKEGWDDMLKDVKAKRGPQPSGGSGVKQGTRYGGGKQKDKPEQDEDKKKVNEAKRPEDDSVPFDPPYNTNPQPTVTDKSGAKHTPMSRAHHLARFAMSRVKKDLGAKKGK